MPLSEEELRLLEQMERALVAEDPKLASTLRGTAFRRSARRRAIFAGVCFVLGVGVLMTGAVARITTVGIIGFVIMLVSATVGLAAMRGQRAHAVDPRTAAHPSRGFTVIDGGRGGRVRRPRRGSGHSFMERVEERWRRRRESGGFSARRASGSPVGCRASEQWRATKERGASRAQSEQATRLRDEVARACRNPVRCPPRRSRGSPPGAPSGVLTTRWRSLLDRR